MTDLPIEASEHKSRSRSTDDIMADIDDTRDRLVANLTQLREETQPKALAQRAKAAVIGVFVDQKTGELRTERVAIVAGSVVGLVVLRKGIRARAQKRQIKRLSEVVWVPVPKSSVSPEMAPLARSAIELGPSPAMMLPSSRSLSDELAILAPDGR